MPPDCVEQAQSDVLEALHHARGALFSFSSAKVLPCRSIGAGHARGAHHVGCDPGGRLEIAADAVRVLAVERKLGGHRSDEPDQLAEHLALEPAEALLFSKDVVVPSEPARILIEMRLDSRSGR